jgi:catechol 2,3-dioxygenase-like lactoylglutathione lyase family enzyme
MPQLNGVLETALYVDDIERACAFYEQVLGLPCIYTDQRLHAYDVGGRGVLLLFRRGQSLHTVKLPGGTIPPHDGSGPFHIAFSIAAAELAVWEERLRAAGIEIEGRTQWPRGGHSIYFRDPDGHLLELATPGLWKGYLTRPKRRDHLFAFFKYSATNVLMPGATTRASRTRVLRSAPVS